MKRDDIADAERIVDDMRDMGYLNARALPDGSVVALGDLVFTRAIYMDCHEVGWQRRYCFEDRSLAMAEYMRLQSSDDEPTGYIAKRGG